MGYIPVELQKYSSLHNIQNAIFPTIFFIVRDMLPIVLRTADSLKHDDAGECNHAQNELMLHKQLIQKNAWHGFNPPILTPQIPIFEFSKAHGLCRMIGDNIIYHLKMISANINDSVLIRVQNISFWTIIGHFGSNFGLTSAQNANFWKTAKILLACYLHTWPPRFIV